MPAKKFPPPNFVKAESALPGIDVYMPVRLVDESQAEIVEFACPNCLASTAYSVTNGALRCASCGYYQPPQQEPVGANAAASEFDVDLFTGAARGWGEQRSQLTCQNCQAVTAIPQGQLTETCPFCGSHKVLHDRAAQEGIRPRFLIPFTLRDEDCIPTVNAWLASSWMTPRALHRMAQVGALKGIYLPFWTFSAKAVGQWRAEVGYQRTEVYIDQKGRQQKRTYIEWRKETGALRVTFKDMLISGTDRIEQNTVEMMGDYDFAGLRPYDPQFLAGWRAQAYETPLEDAWDDARQIMRGEVRSFCITDALSNGGTQVRAFRLQLDYTDETWRYLLLPAYLGVYTYADQLFRVVVNGQTGSVGGARPVDWPRVRLAIVLCFLPALITALLGLLIALENVGIGIALMLSALGAVILGYVGARRLVEKAAQIAKPADPKEVNL